MHYQLEVLSIAKRTFTLFELLVVVAIVAILAALIRGPLTQSPTQKRLAASLTNLKHLGGATGLYSQDYDDRFPYASDAVTLRAMDEKGERFGPPWDAKLSPKLVSEVMPLAGAYRASFDPGPDHREWWMAQKLSKRWISYGYSDFLPVSGRTIASVTNPGGTTLFAESRLPYRNPRLQGGRTACAMVDTSVKKLPAGVCDYRVPGPQK